MKAITDNSADQIARLQVDVLQDVCGPLPDRSRVLDLGCGAGAVVRAWNDLGYDAYGCDFKFKPGPDVEPYSAEGRIRLIEEDPYRLPYPDDHFDVVVSAQVFEHVRDYPATLAEMRRVLKPGGRSLHAFPSRWIPVEPHVFVPLATVVRSRGWLSLWALLGVRRSAHRGMGWRESAEANHAYLTSSTFYLTGRELAAQFGAQFESVQYVERAFLRHSPNTRGRWLSAMGDKFSPVYRLYRAFWARVIVASKGDAPMETAQK